MKKSKWLNILNWPNLPLLGRIHNQEPLVFINNYYLPPSIDEAIEDIKSSLMQVNSGTDKLIIGKPGSGKTTFIYYIVGKLFEEDEFLSDSYYVQIVHFLRFISANLESSLISIEDWVLKLYEEYLIESGYIEDVEGILRNNARYGSNNSKINALLDLVKKTRFERRKKLLIIIDDIDEAPRNKVGPLLRHLYSYMETSSIEKWMTIRSFTLDLYPADLELFIRSKFTECVDFPRVDFHGILAQRVRALGENAKNPFSKELCNRLIKAHDEDIRIALGASKGFFKINPRATYGKDTSEEEIKRYFLQNLLTLFLKQRLFPNIYLNSRSPSLPIEKDILFLINFKPTIDETFLAMINKYYADTTKALERKFEIYDKESLVLSYQEVAGVTRYLTNTLLIRKTCNNCYFLTGRGRALLTYILEKDYRDTCFEECSQTGERKQPIFWILARVDPSFGVDVSSQPIKEIIDVSD
jgi:Cdc6-like AAA superfamily ATPase